MTEFTALPVGCGDSFFLHDDDMNVLVDGGMSINKETLFLNQLYQNGIRCIDVAICTHNDADHAKGLRALFSLTCKITVKKLYLPLEFKKFQGKEDKESSLELSTDLFRFLWSDQYFHRTEIKPEYLVNLLAMESNLEREVVAD